MRRKWCKSVLFRNRKLFRRFQNRCFVTIVIGQVWVISGIVVIQSLNYLAVKLLKLKKTITSIILPEVKGHFTGVLRFLLKDQLGEVTFLDSF